MIKKKKKLPQYIYFKRSLTFLFKSQLVVSIALLIEYFDIYVNSIDMTKQLFSYKSEYTDKGENKIIRSIKYISTSMIISSSELSLFFSSTVSLLILFDTLIKMRMIIITISDCF